MSRKLYVTDTFKKVSELKTNEEKINFLIDQDTPLLQSVIYHAYSPEIKYHFKKIPPYKKNNNPTGEGWMSLEYAVSKLYIQMINHWKTPRNLEDRKREQNLIQTLESLAKDDAELLEAIILQKLPITKTVAKKAFPGLLKNA